MNRKLSQHNGQGTKFPLILSVIVLVIAISCKKSTESEEVSVSLGAPTLTKLEAIGAEMDPHFFSQNLTRNDGSKESDWQYAIDRVKKMGLQKFRIMAQPQWYEPYNDNDDARTTDLGKFTFESQEMQSMYKVLDLAQEQRMDVCIVVWGCPTSVSLLDPEYIDVKRCFMADPEGVGWITGPTDYDEWAENFSVLIRHLVIDKGYTCVNEITPMNEPDGGPLLSSEEYIKMAKVLDARFKKEGIRDKVRFNLSDNTDTRVSYLEDCAANLQDVADIFNSHTYIFGYDTPNKTIQEWEKNNVSIAARVGKKHLVGEFGSNQCVGATRQLDIDRYERGVLMSRLVLNFLNSGAAGVSYWSLIDQYYNRNADCQEMQQLGLWRYIRDAYKSDDNFGDIEIDYQVRPQYYSYTMLTRFIRPGAEIYPIDLKDEFAAATAFKNEDGKWVYVFANNTVTCKFIAVNNPEANGEFEVYRYEKNNLPNSDQLIESDETVRVEDGKFQVTVERQSVVLCRQP